MTVQLDHTVHCDISELMHIQTNEDFLINKAIISTQIINNTFDSLFHQRLHVLREPWLTVYTVLKTLTHAVNAAGY